MRGRAGWALAAWLVAAPAAAAEWHVRPGQAIAPVLSGARPGDVVRLAPGTYRERVTLDKAVALVGEGMPTLDGGGTGDVVTLKAAGARVEGLHVTNGGREILSDTAGVKLLAQGVVAGLRIDHCLYGIYLTGVTGARIAGNVIEGTPELARNDRGDGIRLWNSSHNLIADNRILDARDGIYFDASPFNVVRGNAIHQVRYGLHYMYSDDNVFEGNRFSDTEAGSAVMFSRRITLEGNRFVGNRGYRAYGLLIKDVEDSTVRGNDVEGNRTGIFMDGALNLQVEGNRVVGNDVGLEIRGSAEGNRFVGNTVAGNTQSVATPTGIGENTWRGNYWSDYRGYDLDGDGIGDVPHKAGSVLAFLTENLPPARLFLLSPAIQALEFAEQTFPVVAAPGVLDPAPAMRPTVRVASGRPSGYSGGLLMLAALLLGLGLSPLILARKAFRP